MEENIGSNNTNYFTTSFLQPWCYGVCGGEKYFVYMCKWKVTHSIYAMLKLCQKLVKEFVPLKLFKYKRYTRTIGWCGK